MPESETEERVHALILSELNQNKAEYMGGIHVQDELRQSGIRFFPVVGPIGVGKTAITSLVQRISLEPPIHLIDTVTNRPGKESDPDGFRTAKHGITLQSMINDIQNRNFVNFTVIKKTGFVYATAPSGFHTGINTGPVTADNIDTFMKYKDDFDEFQPIYIISPVHMWSSFLRKSLSERPDEVADRAEESIDSLEFARQNLKLFTFIENRDDQGQAEGKGLYTAARDLIAVATHTPYQVIERDYAANRIDEMIKRAKQLSVQ